MENIQAQKVKDKPPLIAPAKFNIILIMMSSSMLFAALVSAFIVHQPDAQAKNTWTYFDLPVFFLVSLVIAAISSVTMILAKKAGAADELSKLKTYLISTFALGLAFCVSQYLGWKQLVALGLTFVNPRPEDISASYVWVITMVHVFHVLGGIILLFIALVRAYKMQIHKKQMTFLSVTNTYWHFVGFLWFILYLFLYFAR